MTAKQVMRFLTVAEIAEVLAVSQRSVRRWIASEELLAHRFGCQVRISEIDFRAFISGRRVV
jgi:excisionase family DNA binding protein